MFKGSYQKKLLTILYSAGSNPLEIWNIQVKNGWTRRVKDEELGCIVFEVCGTNVATAYIVSPPDPRAALAITLPFITIIIKNLKRYFTFEIQILDDKHMRRRFRFSNYQSSTKVRPFTCSVPLALKPGWNQMQLNLANFTTRAYGTNYLETQRVQIHANCRIRRVYFSDCVYREEELPKEYRIYQNVRQVTQQSSKERTESKLEPEERTVSQASHPPSILKRLSHPSIQGAPSELMEQTSLKTASDTSRLESKLQSRGSRSVQFHPLDEQKAELEEHGGSIRSIVSRKSQRSLSKLEERLSMSAIVEEGEPQTPEIEEKEVAGVIYDVEEPEEGEPEFLKEPTDEALTGYDQDPIEVGRTRTVETVRPRTHILESEGAEDPIEVGRTRTVETVRPRIHTLGSEGAEDPIEVGRTRTVETVRPRTHILESEGAESEPPLDSDAELDSEAGDAPSQPPPSPEYEEQPTE